MLYDALLPMVLMPPTLFFSKRMLMRFYSALEYLVFSLSFYHFIFVQFEFFFSKILWQVGVKQNIFFIYFPIFSSFIHKMYIPNDFIHFRFSLLTSYQMTIRYDYFIKSSHSDINFIWLINMHWNNETKNMLIWVHTIYNLFVEMNKNSRKSSFFNNKNALLHKFRKFHGKTFERFVNQNV